MKPSTRLTSTQSQPFLRKAGRLLQAKEGRGRRTMENWNHTLGLKRSNWTRSNTLFQKHTGLPMPSQLLQTTNQKRTNSSTSKMPGSTRPAPFQPSCVLQRRSPLRRTAFAPPGFCVAKSQRCALSPNVASNLVSTGGAQPSCSAVVWCSPPYVLNLLTCFSVVGRGW